MRKQIEDYAKSIGFDLVGFSKTQIDEKYKNALEKWLDEGLEGEMVYMKKIKERFDLNELLPGSKSVIVLGMNYYHSQEELKKDHGRIARYAYGRDYHKIIRKKLKLMEYFIKEIAPEAKTKGYVDAGPVMEKSFAEQAGLGFIGKNGLLISKEFGSWIFLAEIITTLNLENHTGSTNSVSESSTLVRKFHPCGNCRKCIDACPTGAIIKPGVIDSRLCISYLTIENKKEIPAKLKKLIKKTKYIFGCDICQEVCPHNTARQKEHTHNELREPKIAGSQLSLNKIAKIKNSEQYLNLFAGSPLMRAKRKGLIRNVEV